MTSTQHPAWTISEAAIDTEAESLRAALADELGRQGLLSDPKWDRAFRAVPRHRFVPGFFSDTGRRDDNGLTTWEPVTAASSPQRWLAAVYSDSTLITQFDGKECDWGNSSPQSGGAPTSSSTLPSLVLRMWLDADLHDGQSILEVGTGTGYSTALACERLGSSGEVTSIEIDQYRLAQAAAALYGAGYVPDLAAADGLYGYWPSGSFDRIVAACSVKAIPHPWLAQTRPGGKILTTLSGWLYGYARVLLTVIGPDAAEGRLLPGTISFMSARTHERPEPGNPSHWASLAREAPPGKARHDWSRLNDETPEGFFGRFIAQLAVPGTQLLMDGADGMQLVDVTTGSAAAFPPGPGTDRIVYQVGPRRLWDAVEAAWDAWDAAGQPGPESFRMRIGQDGQTISHPDVAGLNFRIQ